MRRDENRSVARAGWLDGVRQPTLWLAGLAVAAGLFAMPIFSAYLIISDHRADIAQRSESEIDYLVGLVAEGLKDPVWELNPAAGESIIRALRDDPRFVSITVTSNVQGEFLSYRRDGQVVEQPVERRRPVVYDGRTIGEVSAVVDAGRLHAAGATPWIRTVTVLVVQLLCGAGLVALLVWQAMRLTRNRALRNEMAERQRTAEALVKSERHLRDIVNAMPMSVFYVDTEFRLQAVNRRCCEWWAKTEDELVGHAYREFYDDERATVFEQNMRRAFAGETWQHDVTLEFADGQTREVEITHVPDIDEQGAARGAFVITHDVSLRNKADRELVSFRQLLQQTIDAAPIAISIKNRDLEYVFANRTALEKFNIARNDMIGRDLDRALRAQLEPEYYEEVVALDRRVIDTREGFPLTEFSTRRDGPWANTLLSKTPIIDANGEVSHVVTVTVDVTELKHAEDMAIAAKEEAELANMAKSEFLANMSHELRTPLNAIIGFSEMMMAQAFGPIGHPKYVEYVADVHTSGTHLHQIITDLLDLSRIEVGAINMEIADVDIGEVIENVCKMLHGKAVRAGVNLIERCERPLPVVRGDQLRLRQIFINLCDNAIKFTDAGGEVAIAAHQESENLVVTVSDTGIGIASADIDRVFEPFVLLQSSTTRNVSGTGLGLSLVKSLSELHGGSLSIESEIGRGTTVKVTLPCRSTAIDEVANRQIA